jgi:hypothetical protein
MKMSMKLREPLKTKVLGKPQLTILKKTLKLKSLSGCWIGNKFPYPAEIGLLPGTLMT